MTVESAVELMRAALMLVLLVGTPLMLVAIVVGLGVSVLQAATQVQDQSLTFVPKIVAMFFAMMYLIPWSLSVLVEYSTDLFHAIPGGL